MAENKKKREVKSKDKYEIRMSLANRITKWGLLFIFILIGVIVITVVSYATFSNEKDIGYSDFSDFCKYILGVTLPVVSTWVGTIIAFYFSKENYEAAGEMFEKVHKGQSLSTIMAEEVMIPIENAVKLQLKSGESEGDKMVKRDIIDNIEGCSDIFVTEDGSVNSRVLGWITDKLIRERAVV